MHAGDLEGAVDAWRPLLNNGDQALMPAGIFDAVREPEVASKLDRADIDWYDEVTVAPHAREAKRAWLINDRVEDRLEEGDVVPAVWGA